MKTRSIALLATVTCASACGLISSDVTNFDLNLPDKAFTVDAGTWQVSQQQADAYLATSCASNAGLCDTAAQSACTMGCSGECDAATHTCDLTLEVSLYRGIDLVNEKPELKSINDEPVIKVTIDSVTYEVTGNTLSVPTPALTLYVAPMSVTDPKDAQAKAIGTIAMIPANTTTDGPVAVTFTATGKADLVAMMSTFKTPFNVLVGTQLTVKSGEMLPMGKLDAVVHIDAHAGL